MSNFLKAEVARSESPAMSNSLKMEGAHSEIPVTTMVDLRLTVLRPDPGAVERRAALGSGPFLENSVPPRYC